MHCFACFDETIDFYRWYESWKSYITIATMQKQNGKTKILPLADCSRRRRFSQRWIMIGRWSLYMLSLSPFYPPPHDVAVQAHNVQLFGCDISAEENATACMHASVWSKLSFCLFVQKVHYVALFVI